MTLHITLRSLLATGVCLGLGLSSQGALASDSKGMYQTLYYIPCESYIQHRKEPPNTGNNAIAKIYVSGWLSGYNYVTPQTYNILSDMGSDDVLEWIDDYCAKNTGQNLDAALLQLTKEKYDTRLQEFSQPVVDDASDPVVRATSSPEGRQESRFMLARKPKPGKEDAKNASEKKE
jgi:hypothetical protein